MIEIKTPVLPESVIDATIISWHFKVGDYVSAGENLCDLETDKVSLEIPAPKNGVITEILKEIEDVVQTGDIIMKIDDTATKPSSSVKSPSVEAPETTVASEPSPQEPPVQEPPVQESDVSNKSEQANAGSVQSLNPSARKLMDSHNLSREEIAKLSDKSRITKGDVKSILSNVGSKTTVQREETRAPMPRIRQKIADRLLDAQKNAALLTTFNEVNLKQIAELRKQAQEKFVATYGVKLGYMSFFVRASCLALAEFPQVNANIDGKDIIYRNYMDISVAVSTDKGLVVPVIKDAQTMSFAEIEATIIDFAMRARAGKLAMEEMIGGSFSITNGGIFGSLLSTPIVNPPQSAILGMHKIMDRPIAEDGQVVIRPMMNLALTYDHRIIDGKEAVSFLVKLKELLENPALLLMGL